MASSTDHTNPSGTSPLLHTGSPEAPPSSENSNSPMRKLSPASLSHRICHPPKLERKYSSGDLHSRLKTRKILGVGETDNGDIHRSKISQVLGHNEHLFVKFPRGYWLWHLIMAVLFTVWGLLNTVLPWHFCDMTTRASQITDQQTILMTRFYGAFLLGVAYILWSYWGLNDKTVIRALLAGLMVCQILQTGTVALSHFQEPGRKTDLAIQIGLRLVMMSLNAFFYRGIGSNTSGMRRSNSFKDLRESPSPGAASSGTKCASLAESSSDPATSSSISTASKKTE